MILSILETRFGIVLRDLINFKATFKLIWLGKMSPSYIVRLLCSISVILQAGVGRAFGQAHANLILNSGDVGKLNPRGQSIFNLHFPIVF